MGFSNHRTFDAHIYEWFMNLDHFLMPVIILDEQCCIYKVNEIAAQLYGETSQSMIGMRFVDLSQRRKVPCPIDNTNEGSIQEISYEVEEGSRTIQWNIHKVTTEENFQGSILTGKDLTQQRALETNLKQLTQEYEQDKDYVYSLVKRSVGEQKQDCHAIKAYTDELVSYHKNIIENVPGLIYWKDKNGKYLGCNKNLVNLFNLSSTEKIIGKTDYELAQILGVSDSVVDKFIEDDIRVMDSGIPLLNQEESPFKTASGEEVYQLSNRIPLRNTQGKVFGILCNTLDITDKKRAEKLTKDKKQAQATITQLKAVSGSMAHQLSTPLAGLRLSYDYIQERFPELIAAYHSMVRLGYLKPKLTAEELKRLKALNDQIIERIDKAEFVIEHHLVNLNENRWHTPLDMTQIRSCSINKIIEEAINDFPFIDNQQDLIQWQQGEDFKVLGEKDLLVHVIQSLIENSLESIQQAGKGMITIGLEKGDADNKVHIKDTGEGLPRPGRSEIFNPFITTRVGGTGLGLYFCKSVMQTYLGDISCMGQRGQYAYAQFSLKFPPYHEAQQKFTQKVKSLWKK